MSWPDNGPDTVQPRKSGSVANASNAEKSPEANDGEDATAPPAAVAPAATAPAPTPAPANTPSRSEEHTSELQSLMRISYAVFCLNKHKYQTRDTQVKLRLDN